MGLLDGLLGQIAGQALGGGQQQNGNVLGNVLGGLMGGNQQQSNGNVLGNVLGGLMGGNAPQQPQAGGSIGGIPPQLLMALLPMVLGWVQQQGGLGNILGSLTNSGLGQQAQSWVGTGENAPVDPAQMTNLFGADQIAQVAATSGVSTEMVSGGLAQLLPTIINQLTPAGNANNAGEADNDISQALNSLSGLFK